MRCGSILIKELREPWFVWLKLLTHYIPFFWMLYLCVTLLSDAHSIGFWGCFSHTKLLLFVVWCVVFSTLLTLFSYWAFLVGGSTWIVVHSVQDLMEPKPIGRIVHNLGILLMNSNCFVIYFQQHSRCVSSDICMCLK